MHSLSFVLAVIGNVLSALIFASPMKTFFRVVRNGSTEDFEGLPYVCAFLNCSLWTYYGLTKPGGLLLATVNIVGMVLELIYIILFLIYAPPFSKAKTAILVVVLDVGFLGGAILVTRLAVHGSLRLRMIGILTAGISVIMYGSPLAIMKTVIRTKSVEFMPFLLSFSLFLNGGVWTFYSLVVRDLFVGLPNGMGFLLGAAQLVLYAIYRNAEGAKTGSEGIEDAQESLIQQSYSQGNAEETRQNGNMI